MKVIIAGSRTIRSFRIVEKVMLKAMDEGLEITQIVSGGAKGVDKLGEKFAKKYDIPTTGKDFYVPDWVWKKVGKRAGYLRNEAMGEYADVLIAIWDGESKGTKNMIDIAESLGLYVYVKKIKSY